MRAPYTPAFLRFRGGFIVSSQLSFFPDESSAQLRWSISRDKRLKICPRRYYLQHYGSRGGGNAEADETAQHLYILKWLRNRYMWVGEVVHELVEDALEFVRNRQPVKADALIRRGTQRMRLQYSESLHGLYRTRPRYACGLVEHEYEMPIDGAEWRRQRDRMERCVRNFFAMPIFEAIRETPDYRWLALESMSTFHHDGATVVVKPDFAWRGDDGRVNLVDWKTGRANPEDERLQLAVYALFARREWGAAPGEIRGIIAYLERGEVRETTIDDADLEFAENAIRDSVATMRGLDEPAPPEERFAMTEDLGACELCNFRRHCGR